MRYLLLLHLVVVIFGFTGILGRLISIDAAPLVWYRMSIAFVGIGAYLWFRNARFRVSVKAATGISATGVLVAAHWICFFASIKASTISLALVCLSSTALFIAFLEPIAFRRRVYGYEVVFGLVVILALGIVFQVERGYAAGIAFGVASAFLAACFSVVNGRLITRFEASVITLYELAGGVAGVSLFLLWSEEGRRAIFAPNTVDLVYLTILGLICTAFAYVASVEVMKELSPYSVSLAINLEPIYGIILALLVFGEDERMHPGFYLGAILILATLFGNAIFKRHSEPIGHLTRTNPSNAENADSA